MGKNVSRLGPYDHRRNIRNIANVPEGSGHGDKTSKLCKKKAVETKLIRYGIHVGRSHLHYIRSCT